MKGKIVFAQEGEAAPSYFEKPIYQAKVETNVAVPFLWAAISSLVMMAAVILGSWWLGTERGIYVPGCVIPLVGIGTFGLAWMWRSQFLFGLLKYAEPFVGVDLDGDGNVGPKTTIRVEQTRDGKIKKYFDPDVFDFASDDAFVAFAQKLINTSSLTEAVMGTDKKAFPKGINAFRRTRGMLESHGYIERTGQSWSPTDHLLDICEAVLKHRGYVDESAD